MSTFQMGRAVGLSAEKPSESPITSENNAYPGVDLRPHPGECSVKRLVQDVVRLCCVAEGVPSHSRAPRRRWHSLDRRRHIGKPRASARPPGPRRGTARSPGRSSAQLSSPPRACGGGRNSRAASWANSPETGCQGLRLRKIAVKRGVSGIVVDGGRRAVGESAEHGVCSVVTTVIDRPPAGSRWRHAG